MKVPHPSAMEANWPLTEVRASASIGRATSLKRYLGSLYARCPKGFYRGLVEKTADVFTALVRFVVLEVF